jgi:hypothetical protein
MQINRSYMKSGTGYAITSLSVQYDVRIYDVKLGENEGMPLAVSLSACQTTRGHAITCSLNISTETYVTPQRVSPCLVPITRASVLASGETLGMTV